MPSTKQNSMEGNHKGWLNQWYAQNWKGTLEWSHTMEGDSHAPQITATVISKGANLPTPDKAGETTVLPVQSFTSGVCKSKKQAEHEAALRAKEWFIENKYYDPNETESAACKGIVSWCQTFTAVLATWTQGPF